MAQALPSVDNAVRKKAWKPFQARESKQEEAGSHGESDSIQRTVAGEKLWAGVPSQTTGSASVTIPSFLR